MERHGGGGLSTGPTQPGLRLVPDEPDQVRRLHRFRDEHPHIAIGAGAGYWQAVVPEINGEAVLTRYLLRDLLDKLDDVLGST
jgi:hypothetical protein